MGIWSFKFKNLFFHFSIFPFIMCKEYQGSLYPFKGIDLTNIVNKGKKHTFQILGLHNAIIQMALFVVCIMDLPSNI